MQSRGGLVGLLSRTVAAGDINASCGVLRRIFSETLEDAAVGITSPAKRHGYHPKRILNRAQCKVKAALLTQPVGHEDNCNKANGSLTSSSHLSREGDSLAQRVVQLGRLCLRDDAELVKPSSVSVLCHIAQRHGDWQGALHFCDYLLEPPSPVFTSSLLTPGNVQDVFRHCAKAGFNIDAASAIRVLAQEQGSWSSALVAAREAERLWPYGERYTAGVLVPFLAASGAEKEAVALFESTVAQGALVEPALVQHLILQTAELRQWPTCRHMLRALTRTREAAQLLPSHPFFFRTLTEGSPDWETSLCIFEAARVADAKPDERTLSILLTQCDRGGAWQVATEIYDTAVRENFVDSLAVGITYHALVRSFTASQQWAKALEALTWMGKAGTASMTAGKCELVELCEQSGQWEAALLVGKDLLEAGVEMLSEHTTLSLLFACAKGAQYQLAASILRRQQADVRVQPHPMALCAAIQACVAANEWVTALELLQESRMQQPRTVVPPMAHRLVVKACVRGGRWSEVLSALACMRRDGLPQDNNTQRLGLWAAALSGQWELSLSFFEGIPLRSRIPQDRLVIRSATRLAGPEVDALGLQLLSAHRR